MQTQRLELFADYFQFYLQDESAEGNLGESWNKQAVRRLLALAPGTVGVGTVRNLTVPVTVQVRKSEPKADLARWDQVVECGIEVPSGRLVVAGCTDYFPDAARIDIRPGPYRARVCYGGLDTLSADGLEGEDHYKVVLWPAEPAAVRVLKQWRGQKARYQAP